MGLRRSWLLIASNGIRPSDRHLHTVVPVPVAIRGHVILPRVTYDPKGSCGISQGHV